MGIPTKSLYIFSANIFCFLSLLSAETVGYLMLRLLKPMCSITPEWCEENLLSATKRVLSILHSLTVPTQVLGSASADSSAFLLSATAFAFCFPLLRCLLREGGKAVAGDEDLKHQALQVVAEHCKLRASEDDDEEDEEEQNEVNETIPSGNRYQSAINLYIRDSLLATKVTATLKNALVYLNSRNCCAAPVGG